MDAETQKYALKTSLGLQPSDDIFPEELSSGQTKAKAWAKMLIARHLIVIIIN